MAVLWVTLFLLHQGCALVPVVTVQLGEPVTLTCALTDGFTTTTWLHWYKQSAGENLKVIIMQRQNVHPSFGPEFSGKRFKTTYNSKMSNLTILSTTEQDEGFYHCAHIDWTKATWAATYLSIKGNNERTSKYSVFHQTRVSDLTHPAESETLQCSVLSDSQNKTCSGDLSVFWFRAGSDKSYPDFIYTDGKIPDKCENRSDNQQRCSYNFSKNIRSSDVGTYYCAVATCGQILFGKENTLEIDEPNWEKIKLMVTIIFFVFSVTVNIIFISYQIRRSTCKPIKESSSLQARHINVGQPEDIDLNYAALSFSDGKNTRGKKKRELKIEESVYSQVNEPL